MAFLYAPCCPRAGPVCRLEERKAVWLLGIVQLDSGGGGPALASSSVVARSCKVEFTPRSPKRKRLVQGRLVEFGNFTHRVKAPVGC